MIKISDVKIGYYKDNEFVEANVFYQNDVIVCKVYYAEHTEDGYTVFSIVDENNVMIVFISDTNCASPVNCVDYDATFKCVDSGYSATYEACFTPSDTTVFEHELNSYNLSELPSGKYKVGVFAFDAQMNMVDWFDEKEFILEQGSRPVEIDLSTLVVVLVCGLFAYFMLFKK